MFSKIVCLVAFAALASAQHHHASSYSSINLNHVQHEAPAYHAPIAYHHAPVAHVIKAVHHEEYAHPKYQFKYGVKDTHTHDIKEQEESRDGEHVQGSYSLLQPDGITRIVHYTADKSGFHADVKYDGHASHPEHIHKAKIVAPVYHHAPVYQSYHH